MNFYYVTAVALVILAVAINMIINRRRFYRRGVGGLQHFSSYGKAVATTWLERLGKLLAIVLVLFAIGMLGKGYQQHQSDIKNGKRKILEKQ